MEKAIGDIIIDKLKSLPFVDKYAGLVKPVVISVPGSNGKTEKKFPIACNVTEEQCNSGQYQDLVPDSSKKSVMYLEGRGVQPLGEVGGMFKFRASYDLVVWLNMSKIGYTGCSYSSIAIMSIMSRFPKTPFQSGIFQRITFNAPGQLPKANDPFQKYSYEEKSKQYLMAPFDYFVLQINVDFMVNKRCINITSIDSPVNCT